MAAENHPAAEPAVRKSTIIAVYVLTLLGTLGWLAAIFLAPYFESRSAAGAASVLYAMFAPVCHQIPERSFFFLGFPLAVCGRCLGVYTGFLAGLLAYPAVRGFRRVALPSLPLFVLLSLPIGLDFGGGLLGLWTSPIGLRYATGFVWGTALPYFFVTGLAELLGRRTPRPMPVDSALERHTQNT
jgi:uncharacterized membrane protein